MQKRIQEQARIELLALPSPQRENPSLPPSSPRHVARSEPQGPARIALLAPFRSKREAEHAHANGYQTQEQACTSLLSPISSQRKNTP